MSAVDPVPAPTAWHVRREDLAAYSAGAAGPVLAASCETHLVRCAACRATLADLADAVDPGAAERRWDRLADAIDRPSPGFADRVGLGPWLERRPTARLTWASPAMRGAWLAGVVLVALLPLLAGTVAGVDAATALLAMAPVAPVVAVALAYRGAADPAGEIAAAAPLAGLRLVALRALAVAAGAVPLGVGVALAVGTPVQLALAWVLPGLALAGLVLVVGTTRWDPTPVAVVTSGLWALGVGVPGVAWGAARVLAETIASPGVQVACLLALVAAVAVAVVRRDEVAYRGAR